MKEFYFCLVSQAKRRIYDANNENFTHNTWFISEFNINNNFD